jgi:TonB family protein
MKKFLVISLFFHCLLLGQFFFIPKSENQIDQSKTMTLIELLSDLNQNIETSEPLTNITPLDGTQPESVRFMETPKDINTPPAGKPQETNFISEKNNFVEHETSARTPSSPEKPGIAAADPSSEVIIDQVVGENGSPSYDIIDDLDPGLETLLNSKETVFYDYFSEIRKKINSTWTPLIRSKLKKLMIATGDTGSLRDEVTRCLVSLNGKGQVIKIQIIGKSKYRELDDAAVETFKLATPLRAPPKDLGDSRGRFLIRWDFIIDS